MCFSTHGRRRSNKSLGRVQAARWSTGGPWAATGAGGPDAPPCPVKSFEFPLLSRHRCCDTAGPPLGGDRSAGLAGTPDRAAGGRLWVTAKGQRPRGGRRSSSASRVIAAFALVGALLPASPALPGLATASAAVPPASPKRGVQRADQPDGDPLRAGRPGVRRREGRPHQGVRIAVGDHADGLRRPADQGAQLLGSRPARAGAQPRSSRPDRRLRPVHVRPHP